jgi:hypothetical protein
VGLGGVWGGGGRGGVWGGGEPTVRCGAYGVRRERVDVYELPRPRGGPVAHAAEVGHCGGTCGARRVVGLAPRGAAAQAVDPLREARAPVWVWVGFSWFEPP